MYGSAFGGISYICVRVRNTARPAVSLYGRAPDQAQGTVCRTHGLHEGRISLHTNKTQKMDLSYIILQTLMMMGFTFIVGIAFAYVLKLMTLLFSCLNGRELSEFAARARAYFAELAWTYDYIRSAIRSDDGSMGEMPLDPDTKNETVHAMNGMAEYHFGNLGEPSKKDTEMNLLYELHHGKI